MIRTDADSLARHLAEDLGIQKGDLVFVFSGIWGFGHLTNGLDDISNAFRAVIPDGLLIVPTFTYSWCDNEPWDITRTECPDMGAYSNHAWQQADFRRSDNPNFSVAALETKHNQALIDDLFDTDDSCFGERSVFGNILRHGRERRAWILLLGGAFKDCLFRCTFIHYSQQKVNVPYRFEKTFADPEGSDREVSQLVRYLSEEEYLAVNGHPAEGFGFPVEEDFGLFGEDLYREGRLIRSDFAYYESRMVSVADCCDFFEEKALDDPFYCLPDSSDQAAVNPAGRE